MLVVGQLFAKFAFLATEVQSDAGAGNRLFFCSFRPTFALLGAELKSGRGAGGGVFWAVFGHIWPLYAELKFGPAAGGGAFWGFTFRPTLPFWARSQICPWCWW